MSAYEILGLTVCGLGVLAVALLCLGRPMAIRDHALRTTPKWIQLRGFMESKSYIWGIRLTGVVATLMLLLVLYVLIWGKR